jgi:hypothetical protein
VYWYATKLVSREFATAIDTQSLDDALAPPERHNRRFRRGIVPLSVVTRRPDADPQLA